MPESKAEPIRRIVKLVDAVNHCSLALVIAAASHTAPAFQQFVQKMRKKVGQFAFELRTELGRLGAEAPSSPSQAVAENPLRTYFESILDRYRQALDTALTAHARAMLRRQQAEMQEGLNELSSLNPAVCSHAQDVIPAINVNYFAGNSAGERTYQE